MPPLPQSRPQQQVAKPQSEEQPKRRGRAPGSVPPTKAIKLDEKTYELLKEFSDSLEQSVGFKVNDSQVIQWLVKRHRDSLK